LRAGIAGNLEEMNRITQAEFANSQLLILLAEALERKESTLKFLNLIAFETQQADLKMLTLRRSEKLKRIVNAVKKKRMGENIRRLRWFSCYSYRVFNLEELPFSPYS